MSLLAIWLTCALAQPDVEPPARFAANEELQGYLIEAAENHPALHVAHNQWLAALERIPQAKSLDDPMLTYGQFVQSDVNRAKFALSSGRGRSRRIASRPAASGGSMLPRFPCSPTSRRSASTPTSIISVGRWLQWRR